MGWLDPFPPQDAFYGLSCENFTTRLTKRNWRSKGVIRIYESDGQSSWLYGWIRERSSDAGAVYHVRWHFPSPISGIEERECADLNAALALLNGEDGGVVGRHTRPALKSEWPESQVPVSYVRGIRRRS